MSALISFVIFVLILVKLNCISLEETSKSLTDQPLSNAATNSFNSVDNGTNTVWLGDAIKEIAYYLRAHKFNEYDRRYEANTELARREYYVGFPRPPLRSLHWEVHKYCEQSLIECANYLRKRIRNAGMKRADDTAVVINEQQWYQINNSKQIEIVNSECLKMRKIDDILANPFEGPIERFQWRVTASYYMCWYTMQSDPILEHIHEKCDNYANCLNPELGANNRDERARDDVPYSCALYSFCPDPCCPMKHLTRSENCWNSPDNPCFAANPAGQRECVVNRSLNTDFRDLVLNRWNVSCSCPDRGFEWNSLYSLCVDVDECARGEHNCDVEKETCCNVPGQFKCTCKWGHIRDKRTQKCIPSDALTHLILQKEETEEKINKTIWMKISELFQSENFASNNFHSPFCLMISSSILFLSINY